LFIQFAKVNLSSPPLVNNARIFDQVKDKYPLQGKLNLSSDDDWNQL